MSDTLVDGGYFFESLLREEDANVPIMADLEARKNKLSEQRRNCRDRSAKKDIFEALLSLNLKTQQEKIESELMKQVKEQSKMTKQESTHKKDEKRKLRRNVEKVIAEIFKLQQDIEHKQSDVLRFESEYSALHDIHQKRIDDISNNSNNASSYAVEQLIDVDACKQRCHEQQQQLHKLIDEFEQHSSMHAAQQASNAQLQKSKVDVISKKTQSYRDALSLSRNKHNNGKQALTALDLQLKSMQSLSGITSTRYDAKQRSIVVHFASYVIRIVIAPVTAANVNYDIQSVQITSKQTSLDEISRHVVAMHSSRVAAIQPLLVDILLILAKLPARYRDIGKLCDIYGEQDMLPWLPENTQLVFKFSFDLKQNHGAPPVVLSMQVPLVIIVSWDYPQCAAVCNDELIIIEHYNCSLSGKNAPCNGKEIESEWSAHVDGIVQRSRGKFQNDIVSFVGFIYDELKAFANRSS